MDPRRLFRAAGFLSLALAAGPAVSGTPLALDHEVKVRLDPASRMLRVEDDFVVEAAGAVAFELAPWIGVVRAKVNGKTAEVRRAGRQVVIAAAANGRRRVELVLTGVVPELPDPEQRAAPTGAVADAQGGYLPGGSGWMASTGDDWIRYRLSVEVPAAYRVVATGRLADERLDGEIYGATFVAEAPAEPPSIFAGPYTITERREGSLRIRTYFHPELAPLAEDYLAASAEYIRRFADRIGAYPYADFHVVSAPLPVGLGFPNLTYVGRRVLALPFMRGRSLAHEVLHNWWGNGVAVDYARGNWAEGLTTYLADYALAEEQGAEAAREMRLSWLRNFAALPADRDLPVERFTAKRHDAAQVVGYDKVAFVFHMLRRELGEAAFGAGLRAFWSERRFRVGSWPDLQGAFERAAGRSLSWFFEQWLERPGAPRVELAEAGRNGDAGAYRVTLRLRQDPPAYRVRLPVIIETPAGPRRREVMLEQPEQDVELPFEDRPLSVRIDPDFDAFRRLLPGESPPIFRDVTLSDETVLFLPTKDAAMTQIARRLARRLLQREPAVRRGDPRDLSGVPVLVIGTAKDIAGLGAPTGAKQVVDIAGQGTARAWTERRPDGAPWLVVAADSAQALEAVARPLPHYRNQSYVVFDGPKVTLKGLWTADASPLAYRFGN